MQSAGFSGQILTKFEFSGQIFEISNFMKILPQGAEWFQEDRRADRHTAMT
jgi:hypothetical protein